LRETIPTLDLQRWRDVAKKKAVDKPAAGTEAKAKPVDRRVMVIALKGTPEFRDWLSAASKKTRIPASNIVEVALANWAVANGVPEPPSR
jgi:hypothetical protein